jgi:hypothetical protein
MSNQRVPLKYLATYIKPGTFAKHQGQQSKMAEIDF